MQFLRTARAWSSGHHRLSVFGISISIWRMVIGLGVWEEGAITNGLVEVTTASEG